MDVDTSQHRQRAGKLMAALRVEHGYTQVQAGAALGVAQSTYAEMETGVGRIRRRDLVTLAHLCGVDPAEAFPELAEIQT